MLVLGIDPGIATTGVAIVNEEKGKFTLINSLALTTPASLSPEKRLELLYNDLIKLIKKEKPVVAALEKLFFNTNAKTALVVGQARGVVLLALSQTNTPVAEYTPLQVKMALTGWGRADKKQIQAMVKSILKLPKLLTPDDVSDAAAIALTYLFSYKLDGLKSIR